MAQQQIILKNKTQYVQEESSKTLQIKTITYRIVAGYYLIKVMIIMPVSHC
jgi:hypothetical protein